MIAKRTGTLVKPAYMAVVLTAMLAGASAAPAAPVKLILASQFGKEVNQTAVEAKGSEAEQDLCTVESHNTCQQGKAGTIQGTFQFVEEVAAAPNGNIYVADAGNHRIQELTATGQFVLMFGKEVNQTAVEAKGSEAEQDLCTMASKDKCKAGVESNLPGQFGHPYSLIVDPETEDLYVAEHNFGHEAVGERVQKLTPEGEFVLEIGKEVNENTKGNLCTRREEESEAVHCVEPAQRAFGAPYQPESGSFNFESEHGNILGVGGEGELYVGEEGGVQKFRDNGVPDGEISVEHGGEITALAVSHSDSLYLTYGKGVNMTNVVREFNPSGSEVRSFEVETQEPGAEVLGIKGLALDSEGHLAVALEQQSEENISQIGALYDAASGHLLTNFIVPGPQVKGVAFSPESYLFVATGSEQEVLSYIAKPVAELITRSATCVEGAESETDETLSCTLDSEVNPFGVPETEVWFEWGRASRGQCALAYSTPKKKVEASIVTSTQIDGLRPNEAFCYRPVGEDANVRSPETLTGELERFATPLFAPEVVDSPVASFVGPSSAVLFSELNPENADTHYFFEYSQGKEALEQCPSAIGLCFSPVRSSCAEVVRTPIGAAEVYGQIGATLEAAGLQPNTEYSYRLYVENENAAKTEKCATTGPEATFTTLTTPSPNAVTGGYSGLTSTGATISGTVLPAAVAVGYAFELGIYAGASTQYGTVFSGFASAGSVPIGEELALTGLQPGTTYAYRITVSSGYIDNPSHTLQGQSVTFTTNGSPVVLAPPTVLPQLSIPHIAFPKVVGKHKKTIPKHKVKAKRRKRKKRKKKSQAT